MIALELFVSRWPGEQFYDLRLQSADPLRLTVFWSPARTKEEAEQIVRWARAHGVPVAGHPL